MNMNAGTILQIREVFHFASGVVVVGPMVGDLSLVRPGTMASVWVRGEGIGTVEILSERMPGPRTPTYRSLELRGSLSWDNAAVLAGQCEIRMV